MNKFEEFLKGGFTVIKHDEIFPAQVDDAKKNLSNVADYLKFCFQILGGMSIENGLFRIHTFGSSYVWTEYIYNYFDKYKGKVYPFGYDWMGRQFVVSLSDRNKIYMLDPATGEDFEMEQSVEGFLNDDVVNYQEETFNKDFFNNLLIDKKQNLGFDQCFGFIKPLFLGGKDEMNNYEVTDMEVYWEFNYQIFLKIRNLPPGAKINEIKII
jgi:hypothetical protein